MIKMVKCPRSVMRPIQIKATVEEETSSKWTPSI